MIQGTDPNSKSVAGGIISIRAVDLGDGTGALVTLAATPARSAPAAATTSTQLLPANPTRIAATVVNTDTAKNLYLGFNGAAAVIGTNPVGPGASMQVPSAVVAGALNGIWDTGATGGASIVEYDV